MRGTHTLRRKVGTATIVLASAFVLTGTSPLAANAEIDPAPPAGVPDNPALPALIAVPQLNLAGIATAGGAPNPYGCYGQTDRPHPSEGDVSVHARTNCRVDVVHIKVATSLYRGRWYGAQHLKDGTSGRDFSNTSDDAVARWACYRTGKYTYEADSTHEVTNGQTYYAATTNNDRFWC